MKKVLMLLAIVAIVAACQKDEVVNDDMTLKGAELVGAHYNLNIIGVKDKTADMTGSNGHVIFVPIEGATAIWLQEGEEYMVLDANGTDRDGAKLMLPDPGLDPYIIGELTTEDVISDYSVYVRPLGKPGGLSTITTCATVLETLGDFISKEDYRVLNRPGLFGGVASLEQVGAPITLRSKGKSSWTNVTAQLLTIVLEIQYDDDGDGVLDDDDPIIYARIPIFDDLLENEYWEYVNDGLKLLQVRFYPWGTDVSESDLAEWK